MIDSLTSLRFLVITLIYFHHLSYSFGFGPAGVTFFFVLSGFVIGYVYNLKFISLVVEQVKLFYVKRLIKLYPLHIFTFLIAILLLYLPYSKPLVATNIFYTLCNFFLLQSYFPNGNQIFAFNALAWFLSDIVLFYLVTPFILFFLHKFQIAKNLKFLLLLSLLLFFVEIALALLFSNKIASYTFGWWFIYISPYFRVFDYGIGLVFGLVFVSIKDLLTHPHSLINKVVFSVLEITSIILFGFSFY